MLIRYVEYRCHGWDDCARGIISKLAQNEVKKGQVLWINAHNNDSDSEAIMSAYWDDDIDNWDELEDLNISFHSKNDHDPWDAFYEDACQYLATLRPEDVISVTASCNYGGRAVMFVFHYEGEKLSGNDKQEISFCNESSHAYETAANKVVEKMKNEGVKPGQIIGIDVHNSGTMGDARFCAFWNRGLPATGDLNNMIIKDKNDHFDWDMHYRWVCNRINIHYKPLKTVHSITSCCNYHGRGVTYAFLQEG